jgi:hypothetical protein
MYARSSQATPAGTGKTFLPPLAGFSPSASPGLRSPAVGRSPNISPGRASLAAGAWILMCLCVLQMAVADGRYLTCKTGPATPSFHVRIVRHGEGGSEQVCMQRTREYTEVRPTWHSQLFWVKVSLAGGTAPTLALQGQVHSCVAAHLVLTPACSLVSWAT